MYVKEERESPDSISKIMRLISTSQECNFVVTIDIFIKTSVQSSVAVKKKGKC